MNPRRSDVFFAFALAAGLALAAALAIGQMERQRMEPALRAQASLVRRLGITDLCLFTEARYTRHPSQADRFAALQDHPLSLEHFPSGSLVPAPR